MIKLAVDSGITDLRTIRDVYNSYAEGGSTKEDNDEPKPNATVYTRPKGTSKLKDLAYRIGTYDPIQQEGAATPINIIKALLRKDVPMDDNKYAYLYGTEGRYPELEGKPQGFDYSNYLNRYGYQGVKNVQGTINPVGEYHIDESLRPLAEELARNNYHFYDDADDMFLDYDPDVLGYRDDVANFIHQFALDKNGNVVVHDSDVYDFNPVDYQYSRGVTKPLVKLEAKMMDKIGTPYIIRQENQPLKFDGSRRGSAGIEDHLMSMSPEDIAKATNSTLLDTVFVEAEHPDPDYDPYDFADGGYIPSDSIKDYIKGSEAFRSNWYKDANGIDTVGYGFTGSKVKELYPNGMTKQQADDYFDGLVTRFARRMEELTPNIDRLTQNQKDALFSYFYNIGEGTYSRKSPKMQKALQDMDWDTVVQNIDAGYNDKKNPGLRKRRDYERALFEQDIPRPLQPVPPVVNRGPLYNPTISRFNTTIPFKNSKEEVFNPFMFNLKP